MMYCQYCKSKIFEEDRVCDRCGAPTKDFIEETEEVKGHNIPPEFNAPIHSIAVMPSILSFSRSKPSGQLQVYGIKGGASHNVIITNDCDYNINNNEDQFNVNCVGLINVSKNVKSGSRAKVMVSYTNNQNELLLGECVLQVV